MRHDAPLLLLLMLFFDDVESLFRLNCIAHLILLKCRALVVFQASPRLRYAEGSLSFKRALTRLVESNICDSSSESKEQRKCYAAAIRNMQSSTTIMIFFRKSCQIFCY